MRRCIRILAAAIVVSVALAGSAGAATVTVGSPTVSGGGSTVGLASGEGFATLTQLSAAGVGAVVTGDGVITGWRVHGDSNAPSAASAGLELRVLRSGAGGTYTIVATSTAVVAAAADGSPTHAVSIPVQVGDRVGVSIYQDNAGPHSYVFTEPLVGASIAEWAAPSVVDPGTSFAPYPLADQQLMLNATVDLTPPSLSGLSAASGSTAGGESIVISGQHLANATQVLFGSAPGTITTNSNTQVTVTVPAQAATTVDVTVTTAGGSTPVTTAGRYAFVSPPASAGTGSPSPSPGPGSADITAPAISAFVVSPTTFMAANSGPSAVEAAAVGARVVYRLSEAASTMLTVERKTHGRKRGGRCVVGTSARGAKPCSRYSGVKGFFSRSDAAGLNTFRFMGRLAGKALAPGDYRLVAVASDSAGNRSRPARRPFRITR